VLVVSGPSGAGKGTLIAGVRKTFPELEIAISATTRPRRPGERDGVDYHFLSEAEFDRLVGQGGFLEHVEYAGNQYGTLRSEIDDRTRENRSVVLEIELAGARAVRQLLPEATSVFIAPPSVEELERRLERRATDSEADIARRIAVSRWELRAAEEFDYVIVNADIATATDELRQVVENVLGATDG
jgi:guanylate kinase